jgi:hypothetical protein
MRRGMRLTFATSIAAAALLAFAIAPAGAQAAKILKLETGGSEIVGGAKVSLSSTEVGVSNAFFHLACTSGTMSGSVDNNNKGTSDGMVLGEGVFGGGGEEGVCGGTPEFLTKFQPVQTPELVLSKTGKALLHFVTLRLVPRADIEKPENKQEACIVSATTMRGTFPVTTTPQPLVVTFTAAKMKLQPEGAECGAGPESKPTFTATFTGTSHGSQIEAVVLSDR